MMGGYRDLKIYQLAYKLAMELFNESKSLGMRTWEKC